MNKTLIILMLFLASSTIASVHPAENRIRIAIIDTGLKKFKGADEYLCKEGNKSFTDDKPFQDSTPMLHGTNIFEIIKGYVDPKKYCLLVIKYYDPARRDNPENLIKAILYATSQNAEYINISSAGEVLIPLERDSLKVALARGAKISVAAGNNERDLNKNCDVYPACYSDEFNNQNFHVVGAFDKKLSNYGRIVKYLERGENQGTPPLSGTSQATANHTGKWASGQEY